MHLRGVVESLASRGTRTGGISASVSKPGPQVAFGFSQRAVGTPGAGGSFGFADRDARLGSSSVMNNNYYMFDDLARALRDAVHRSIRQLSN